MDKKEYHRIYNINRYYKIKEYFIDFLGGQCNICGSRETLEFDHINSKDKKFAISKFLTYSKKVIFKELKKCQLLCKKCHIYKTIQDLGYEVAKGTHGNISAYKYCGPPKCNLCKEANRKYRKIYYKKYFKTRKRITINGKRVIVPR